MDLPGYGFAKVSKEAQKGWQKFLEDYLLNSKQLRMLILLIDSKVGPKENDQQLVEWLEYNKIPYRIIATKVDKISKSARATQAKLINGRLNQNPPEPLGQGALDILLPRNHGTQLSLEPSLKLLEVTQG